MCFAAVITRMHSSRMRTNHFGQQCLCVPGEGRVWSRGYDPRRGMVPGVWCYGLGGYGLRSMVWVWVAGGMVPGGGTVGRHYCLPPTPVNVQTSVKTLPSNNFDADGNNKTTYGFAFALYLLVYWCRKLRRIHWDLCLSQSTFSFPGDQHEETDNQTDHYTDSVPYIPST